jgi:probable addiction module antidote protein
MPSNRNPGRSSGTRKSGLNLAYQVRYVAERQQSAHANGCLPKAHVTDVRLSVDTARSSICDMNRPDTAATPPASLGPPCSSEPPLSYLDTALERNDEAAFMNALRQIVKARGGFTAVAQKTGLHRTALYKLVSARHDPKLSTVMRLLPGLGLRLSLKRYEERDSRHIRTTLQRGRKP